MSEKDFSSSTHTWHFRVSEVVDYIQWSYFFHAWGFSVRQMKCTEAQQLQQDAIRLIREFDENGYSTHFRALLASCNSSGDDIMLADGTRLPMLRQQHAVEDDCCLCLADFIRPVESGVLDKIGLFASTVDAEMEQSYSHDDYLHLLSQTVSDRLAEASAEYGHLIVRKFWWGYASDESLDVETLFKGGYQGIRPAVGYPSLPDQSLNFLLSDLLDFPSLGISLTENAAMRPHASTSGLMLAHPKSRYFAVGEIGEDQLQDYARRRGLGEKELRRFLRIT